MLETAAARLDESELRAAFVDDELALRVPLHRRGNGDLSGKIRVALLDANALEPTPLGERRVSFEQADDDEIHQVRHLGAEC